MKKTAIVELTIGLLLLVTALYTYIPQAQFMYELTFLSNTAGAVVFLCGGICGIAKRKQLPNVLFLIEAVTISVVFLISVGGTLSGIAHFNFSGGMFFLHVINPLLVVGFYLFAKGEKQLKPRQIFLAPSFLTAYLLFDYIRFLCLGEFVYGLFPKDMMNVLFAVLIGLGAYVLAQGLGGFFHETVGLGIGILFIIHIVLNIPMIKGIFKAAQCANPKAEKVILLISDMALTVCMPIVIVTGALIARELFSVNSGIPWQLLFDVHNVLSYVCLGIMVLHLLMHAKYLVGVFKKLPSSGAEMKSAVCRFSA